MRARQGAPFKAPVTSATSAALDTALLTRADRDERTPCQHGDGNLWTGEELSDRRQAATRCIGCSLMTLCGRYADEIKASWGIWAGTDRAPTTRKPAAA